MGATLKEIRGLGVVTADFYQIGLEQAQQQQFEDAIASFSKAIQHNPHLANAYSQRGLAYYDLGQLHQAISDYTQALERDNQSVLAYYGRALTRLALQNLPGAMADVEEAIRYDADHALAYRLRGVIQRKQGDIQAATTSFKKAAELFINQRDVEGARQCLATVETLQPPEAKAISKGTQRIITSEKDYFEQLVEKAQQGNIQQALADINWILTADPKDGKAYCCRGIVRAKQGQYQEALSDFNQALLLNFQQAIVYRNRGHARLQLGDHPGAVADFNHALQLEPEQAQNYVSRGMAYHKMGHVMGAVEDYGEALRLKPDHAAAFYQRGLAHLEAEERLSAIADLQRAISLYIEQEDWVNHKQALATLQQVQASKSAIPENREEQLRQKLMALVGGQWAIAERFLRNVRAQYPGRSEEWYFETVILDLERDRGV